VSNHETSNDRVSAVKLALMARSAREKVGAALAADPIAIIGIGCRFPGESNDPESFWSFLLEGRNTVVPVPTDRWDSTKWHGEGPDAVGLSVAKGASFLDSVDTFDAGYFGIPPREADQMDPQQRMFLEVAVEALEDAGLRFEDLRKSRTGVFAASYHNDYAQMLYRAPKEMDQRTLTGTLHSVLVNRLSYFLDLRGPSVSVDTACSSSLVAVHLACQSLRTGESNVALAGGVSIMLSPELMVSMSRLGFLAPDGRCKTFDASADGFGRGEGCGMIVLKRLSDALADGDRIWSVIRGSAVNQDGESTLLAAPNVQAQAALVREAVATSQVNPDDIVYIETHGTGTVLGDPIEIDALSETIGAAAPGRPTCLLGGVKANIGHLEAGAGVAGIIKAALVLYKGEVPSQPGFHELNPHINLTRTRLEVAAERQLLPKTVGAPVAGVSSFGVGGTNAHVVLEGPPSLNKSDHKDSKGGVWTIPLSGRTPRALEESIANWQAILAAPTPTLQDLCYTATQRRTHHAYRVAVSASSRSALAQKLSERIVSTTQAPCPKLCFVFCGQGPQTARMGLSLAASEPVFEKHLQRCDTLIKAQEGWSLLEELGRDVATSKLHETAIAQPALTALQTGLVALLKSWSLTPDSVTGHSVGEIAALEAAGILSLEEAMRISCHRGRIMQEADGTGAMASVLMDEQTAADTIAKYGSALSIGAVNAPGETVISGDARALEKVLKSLEAKGIGHHRLPVKYAFHSEQMSPFEGHMVETIGHVTSSPANRVCTISTVTGRRIEQVDAAHFARGIRAPVQFSKALQATANNGRMVYLEIGPHPVLLASITACLEQTGQQSLPIMGSLRRGKPEQEAMADCAARLFEAGQTLDWSAIVPTGGSVVSLPTYPWQRQRYWREVKSDSLRQDVTETGHPLLGHRLSIAADDLMVFEGDASTSAVWLKDHRVLNRTIVPATAIMELLTAAARAATSPSACLEDLSILSPLPLSEAGELDQHWQVLVRRIGQDWSVQLNLPYLSDGMGANRTIATATISTDGKVNSAPGNEHAALQAETRFPKDAQSVSIESIAAYFQGIGAEFGPSFQLLSEVKVGGNGAIGRISLPESLKLTSHILHPAALDAGLQLCVLAAASEKTVTWLPVAVGSLTFPNSTASSVMTAEARLHQDGSSGTLLADISYREPDGKLIAQIKDISFARATTATLSPGIAAPVRSYSTRWREKVLNDTSPAEPIRSWLVISDSDDGPALTNELKRISGHARLLNSKADDSALQNALQWLSDAPAPRQLIDCIGSQADVDPVGLVSNTLARVQALALRSDVAKFATVTRGAFCTSEEFTIPSINGAAVNGFAATARLEHPELDIRCVDLDPNIQNSSITESAVALSDALGHPGSAKLARRNKTWFAPCIEEIHFPKSSSPKALRRQDTTGYESLTLEAHTRLPLLKGQVRIAVRRAGLNFRDVLSTVGMLPGMTLPLGVECAGEVIEVSPDVDTLNLGDRVFGYTPGAFAEQVVAPAALLMRTPDQITDDDAAGITIAFGTALYGLDRLAGIKRGERILIHAGAGGVGLAAIQIALARGAEVFTTAGSEKKRDMLRNMGVEHVFDSRTLDFESQIRYITNGAGVEVVLNSLSGDFISASARILSKNGRFLELGKRELLSPEEFAAIRPSATYHVYDLGNEIEATPDLLRDLLEEVLRDIEKGALSPLPNHNFGLDQAANAMRFMASAKHIGKIVLRIPPQANANIREDATYWITGGVGGIGLYTAHWLARKGARHIALSGRNAPTQSAKTSIAELEALGVAVRVFESDIGDEDSTAKILRIIADAMPPLRGVIHAAGSLRDGTVLTRRPDDVEAVFHGKLVGALTLDRLTRDLPLDFFVLYSASGTTLGAPGQSLYAAANAGLDALATTRKRAGYPALSIAWGFWGAAGMGARLTERSRDVWIERGLGEISPESGFPHLEHLLSSSITNAMAISINWHRFAFTAPEALDLGPFASLLQNQASKHSRPVMAITQSLGAELAVAAPAERRSKLHACIERAVRNIMGLQIDDDIDPTRPLKDMGLDSLMAVELRNDLVLDTGLRLSATLLFDYPTVDSLLGYLDLQIHKPNSEEPTELRDTSNELDDLSESELATLLEQELKMSEFSQNLKRKPGK
tara:strand:- start:80644 stop:87090 length:6447 start_codon:yes stop_codon:yes gene_type:complete